MTLSAHRPRHGPCACGSGRSFAGCCLPWEESLQRLVARLVSFAASPTVRQVEQGALDVFTGREAASPARSETDLRFLEWLLHDYIPERREGALLGAFADGAAGLEAREEELLLASLLTPVRAYEVAEPPEPRGLVVRDLLSGAEGRVGLLGFDEVPIRSDTLICRLLPAGRVLRPGASVLRLPASCREELLAYLRTAYRMGRQGRHVPLEDFLDATAHLYHHFFQSRGRNLGGRSSETLRWVSFAPAHLTYAGGETRRILASLDRQPELERQEVPGETTRYAWIDLPRGHVRAVVDVAPRFVGVQAETREDLAAAAAYLEVSLRGLIRLPGERAEAPRASTEKASSRDRGTLRGQAFLARILAGWADRPSLLLHGQTPREACRSRPGQQQVQEILLGLERGLERQRRLGRAWVDLAPVREELQIQPERGLAESSGGGAARHRRASMI